ncbi:MAG: ubiquinone biosynthesis methyltransferase UbiE, partial [Mesorhizobium sp.]
MGSVHHDPVGEPTFEPMIQIDMEIKTFVSAWKHCDYVSTYIARMISQNRSDSVRHSNL